MEKNITTVRFHLLDVVLVCYDKFKFKTKLFALQLEGRFLTPLSCLDKG